MAVISHAAIERDDRAIFGISYLLDKCFRDDAAPRKFHVRWFHVRWFQAIIAIL